MLFRMCARSLFSTASRARRSDLLNRLLPTVKHEKAMPRTKKSPSISRAERFINSSSEETFPLYAGMAGRCSGYSVVPSMKALGSFRLTGQDNFRVADEPRLPTRYHSEQNAPTDGVWIVGSDEQTER